MICVSVFFLAQSASGGDPPPLAALEPAPVVVVVAETSHGHSAEWWAREARRRAAVIRRLRARLKARTLQAARRPPHYDEWLCIHSHEASWTDSGAPYWGGLQFGWNEWQRFGGRYAPTADRATPLQQMWAAEAYWDVSGFDPWPTTARMCGLL